MPQNIKNNNTPKVSLRLNYDSFFDFMLYKGEVKDVNKSLKEIAGLSFSKETLVDRKIYSSDKKVWNKSKNDGVLLENIGFTGVDNGQIVYRKDRISNYDFLNIYTTQLPYKPLEIKAKDYRFFVTQVSGNTMEYTYPIEKEENYIALKGGFFQGFFKLACMPYQVLPDKIDDIWSFKITLRKRDDYDTEPSILNKKYEDNAGMFFYIGTRAENKFWPIYKTDEKKMIDFYNSNCIDEDYCKDYSINKNTVTSSLYLLGEVDTGYNTDCEMDIDDDYGDNDYFSPSSDKNNWILDDYFKDGYTGPNSEECPILLSDYFGEDLNFDDVTLNTSEGIDINTMKVQKFTTDNKFLLFNHTATGFTTDNWVDGTTAEFVHEDKTNANLFPLMNHTETGYTVDNIEEISKKESYTYKLMNDIYNNALGFRIKEDGSIGYRYLIKDCSKEPNFFTAKESYSKPGVIKNGEWYDIKVNIEREGDDFMRIYFYVNERLVFVSKSLPILDLRRLKDIDEKQETVPYNISIGGGSQGLAEVIYLDYYKRSEYTLPIEKYFAGTFIGDISDFSFSV